MGEFSQEGLEHLAQYLDAKEAANVAFQERKRAMAKISVGKRGSEVSGDPEVATWTDLMATYAAEADQLALAAQRAVINRTDTEADRAIAADRRVEQVNHEGTATEEAVATEDESVQSVDSLTEALDVPEGLTARVAAFAGGMKQSDQEHYMNRADRLWYLLSRSAATANVSEGQMIETIIGILQKEHAAPLQKADPGWVGHSKPRNARGSATL